MSRHRILVLVMAATLVSTIGTGVAGAESSVTDGLLLIGTDAAYVQFDAAVDDCHGLTASVGFVEADGLQSPLGSGQPHFHSDVGVDINVYAYAELPGCGDSSLLLSGVEGIYDPDRVDFATLESASLDGFDLFLTGNEEENDVTVSVTLDLDWTAVGDVFTDTNETPGTPGSHSSHRSVDAVVDGSVTFHGVSGGGDLTHALYQAYAGEGVIETPDPTYGQITRYQEIQTNVPAQPRTGSHPELEGTWESIDCASTGEGVDCNVWGDGSTMFLTIGSTREPTVELVDTYSTYCADQGLDTVFTATGQGDYVRDGIWLNFDGSWCGSTPVDIAPYSVGLYFDPGSGTMWEDPDGDGWGYVWYRIS